MAKKAKASLDSVYNIEIAVKDNGSFAIKKNLEDPP